MAPLTGAKVALFATCINDTVKPSVPIATVKLLERLGCTVSYPAKQTCCGQIMTNTGYFDEAVPTVRNYVESFGEYDYIVAPSGSCVGSVKDQHPMLARHAKDSKLEEEAIAVTSRTYEITQFIVDVLGVTDVGAYFPHKVTYHPSCHGLRMTKVGDRPETLLKNVAGIELVDLPDALTCCGFGGTFSVKNSDVSIAMAEDKANNAASTGARYITGGDHACLMNIGGAAHRKGLNIEPIHLVEILASTKEDQR